MVSAVKWEAAPSGSAVVDTGNAVSADTFDASLGAEYDNSTNLNTLAWLELATSSGDAFATAVTRAGASLDIYIVRALDGTNYENTPDVNGEFPGNLLATIPIPTEAQVVPQAIGPVSIPPCKFKLLVYNNTDKSLNNTYQINLYPNNLEGQ